MDPNGTTDSKYVTLVSSDGYEFVVLRDAAMISPAIKGMLDTRNNFREAALGRCVFEEISGVVLEKVCEYFQYWYRYREREDVPDMDIPVELCLELLVAADFLGLDSKTSPTSSDPRATASVSREPPSRSDTFSTEQNTGTV
ncbi:Skp1 family protein [Colletotrichum acutatum]